MIEREDDMQQRLGLASVYQAHALLVFLFNMYVLSPICKGTGISNKISNDLEMKPSVCILHRKKQSQFIEVFFIIRWT